MSPDRYDLPIHYVDTPERLAEALPHWFGAHLLAVDIECSLTGVHHCVLRSCKWPPTTSPGWWIHGHPSS